jgi:hypothetical protein
MKQLSAIIVAILLPFALNAQNCGCTQKLLFVKSEIESNYAGFADKVNNKTKAAYNQLNKMFLKKAAETNNKIYCYALLKNWCDFFHDGHVQLISGDSEDIGKEDSVKLAEAINKTEKIDISPKTIEKLKSRHHTLEGVYFSGGDSTYLIAIIKSKNEYRDFAGIIIKAKNNYWEPGQVKLELKKIPGDTNYYAITYDLYHNYALRKFSFNDRELDGGTWLRWGEKPDMPVQLSNNITFKKAQAIKLTDSILYLQIGTFSISYRKEIDSLMSAIKPLLQTTPFLILDLRWNGGGGDASFMPLLPYIYTNPMYQDGNDILSTKDNINRLSEWINDPNIAESDRKYYNDKIDLMKKNIGHFVPYSSDDTIAFPSIEPNPRKVVILCNKRCASSTEEFLLLAKQSKKVTLMGEHTYGELDYSNWLVAPSLCKEIEFHYSSTRSKRVKKGLGIDNIGIKPDIVLKTNQDWIPQAENFLMHKK